MRRERDKKKLKLEVLVEIEINRETERERKRETEREIVMQENKVSRICRKQSGRETHVLQYLEIFPSLCT